jgi:general secretion pathway protein I
VSTPRQNAAFTLLEVLVALAIVALGMMAVTTQVNQSVAASVYFRDRTLASWVAMNRVTELSLSERWPEVGESNGDVEYAGIRWRWEQRVSPTAVQSLRRVDVSVALADQPERTLHTASAFLGQPTPAGAGLSWAPQTIGGEDQ